MRHRGRNVVDATPIGRNDKDLGKASSTQRKKQFHSALHRFLASVCSFVLFIIVISIPNAEEEQTTIMGTRGGLNNNANGPPSFVTVVLPSVVNPEKRPLRLESISKTWGPASHAVYVVHNTNEYAKGSKIEAEQSSDTTFPQVCLVPDTIKVDEVYLDWSMLFEQFTIQSILISPFLSMITRLCFLITYTNSWSNWIVRKTCMLAIH